jgi:hypothetical protein
LRIDGGEGADRQANLARFLRRPTSGVVRIGLHSSPATLELGVLATDLN